MSFPTCPICGGEFVQNIYNTGNLVCRVCGQSFDGELILKYWDGEKYAQLIRNNPNFPAAADNQTTSDEGCTDKVASSQKLTTSEGTLDQAEAVLSRLWFSLAENDSKKQSDEDDSDSENSN